MQTSRNAGIGLVELFVGVVVVLIATLALISYIAMSYSTANSQRDRVFAYSVAQSLHAEIQALASEAELDATKLIEQVDGDVSVNSLMFAQEGSTVVIPDHQLTGNLRRGTQQVWSYQISVDPIASLENRRLRHVTVRVLKQTALGFQKTIASVSSIVSTLATARPSSQVFDLYLVAIENMPVLWMPAENLRPTVMRIVHEIEQKNPGLEFRTHWITKASYGRNPVYRPYVNAGVDTSAPVPHAYYYPGKLPAGLGTEFYYVPSLMRGRIFTDEGEQNGHDATTNPYPYALADFFNHAMRLPQERELHEARVAAAVERQDSIERTTRFGRTPPPELVDMSTEPTLRLFLEDLCANPDEYEHAIIVNLHGELLPMPPLRNYSDPAKDPVGLPGVRVVAHPEQLRTPRPPATSDTEVRLRVYAYVTDPDTYTGPMSMPTTRPIAIQVMDLDLTDGAGRLRTGITLERLAGGVPVAGVDNYSPFTAAKSTDDATLEVGEMAYEVDFVDPGSGERKFTLLKLYHTPVVARAVPGHAGGLQGLANNTRARLYGLEYVPSCTEPALDFSNDLASPGDGPKNTARWVLTIPGTVFGDARWVDTSSPPGYHDPTSSSTPDRVLTFRTRIWDAGLPDPLASGTSPAADESRYIQPANLSETYTWWASSADAVPVTERSQFSGDPRFVPYKDLLGSSGDFPDAYNRYFDALRTSSEDALPDYPGVDPALQSGPWQGLARCDAPRYLELLRTAIAGSRASLTLLGGAAAAYIGQGNDLIGSEAIELPRGIPTDLTPFGGPGSDGEIDHVVGARRVVRAAGTGYWWGMPWLGELCPDAAYTSQWLRSDAEGFVNGNLTAGTSSGQFFRAPVSQVYRNSGRVTWGTALADAGQALGSAGAAALLNSGSSASSFQHRAIGGIGALVSGGSEILEDYRTEIDESLPITRPFDLSASGPVGEHFDQLPYSSSRHDVDLRRVLYAVGDHLGVAGMEWFDPTRDTAGQLLINSALGDPEQRAQLVELAGLAAVQSYFDAGESTSAAPISRMPRVTIQYPTELSEIVDPTVIEVRFDVEWRRWDGEPYTRTTPSDFADDESSLFYSVMYSRNDGLDWAYVSDGTRATPGEPPVVSRRIRDWSPGAEITVWATPELVFTRGAYLLRVEAYRDDQALHYAYHERTIHIER